MNPTTKKTFLARLKRLANHPLLGETPRGYKARRVLLLLHNALEIGSMYKVAPSAEEFDLENTMSPDPEDTP